MRLADRSPYSGRLVVKVLTAATYLPTRTVHGADLDRPVHPSSPLNSHSKATSFTTTHLKAFRKELSSRTDGIFRVFSDFSALWCSNFEQFFTAFNDLVKEDPYQDWDLCGDGIFDFCQELTMEILA